MVLTAVFVLVVGFTSVHGSKLINQHDSGSGLSQTNNLDDILKHALLKKNLDKEIKDANKEVGEATDVKTQKTSNHQSAVQDEQDAIEKEAQAENAEVLARTEKETAQGTKSAARKKLKILEGKTAAVVQVEEATETLNAANTELATAKATRTQHRHEVEQATQARTQAIKRKEDAEAAETQAAGVAAKAALDLQTHKHHHSAAVTFCESAKAMMPPMYVHMYCGVVDMTAKVVKDGEDAKKAADDALVEAKQEEKDAVNGLKEANLKKGALDKETGNIEAAVDDAETKKAVAEQALQKAIREAHKHFTSKQEIEEAKSDKLREQVEQAKQELDTAKEAFKQAKAKADKAAQDLEDAEEATAEATQNKHAAKSELEQAQLRLEMAESNLRAAQADLENAKQDAKEQLAAAKKGKQEAEKALNQATQVLETHNNKVTSATQKEAEALEKLRAAEAHHADKVICQQGSQAALDEANAAHKQAEYWDSHTEHLEEKHYWDGDYAPIHQAADTILTDKKNDADDAKKKNDKHIGEVKAAHQAMKEARRVKDEATDAWMKLDAQTPLLQDAFVKAESKKNDATYKHEVAEQIHKVYHK